MSTRSHQTSIARRAFLALLLTIGFYALALAMMALVLLLAWADLTSIHNIHIFVILLFAFVAILVSIIPRRDRFEPRWPRLTADQHPRLFERLEMIASRAGQRMPDDVYLLPDFNAWVMDRGRGGRRRVMGIGLPLIAMLDVAQFTAVIAHEFGHYYGGDTRLGPWIHRTHAAIARTLQNLNEGSARIIQAPFNAYGTMFLRMTRSVSREQEYTADRFAALMVGPEAAAAALKRLASYESPVATFWNGLLIPALATGYRPDIMGGLTQMYVSSDLAGYARAATENIIAKEDENMFDTHPCLRDRVAALEGLPAVENADASNTEPAMTLMGEGMRVEDQILGMYLSDERISKLTPIPWSEVGERVFVSSWLKLRDHNRDAFQSFTVDEMGALFQAGNVPLDLIRNAAGEPVEPPEQLNTVYHAATACMRLALIDAGWKFVAQPDLGMSLVQDDGRGISVHDAMEALVRGQLGQKDWTRLCEESGIAGMLLTGGMSPTGPGHRWSATLRAPVRGISFEGGNGATIDSAIIVCGASGEEQGIEAEMSRLREWYGVVDRDWYFVNRSHQEYRGRQINVVEIMLKNGRKRTLYFDVTLWWGRTPEPSVDTPDAS